MPRLMQPPRRPPAHGRTFGPLIVGIIWPSFSSDAFTGAEVAGTAASDATAPHVVTGMAPASLGGPAGATALGSAAAVPSELPAVTAAAARCAVQRRAAAARALPSALATASGCT
ncbi:hypothetical protein I4F81_000082 [Pyropia yezoensis]|uniref:Uncharacterized protein n=1 Tax=Pyropia yezoensis TaxID=2788 RepID=A0ACC3BI78_PYRYE|nr:hypothetical protein I4F81_000082 [Neopyropia yezoensis]